MTLTRSEIDYKKTTDAAILQAYSDGTYDGTLVQLSEAAFTFMSFCDSPEKISGFLKDMSFDGTLSFVECGQQNSEENKTYTHLLLATPCDDRREKLANVVPIFLKSHFPDDHCYYVEHNDTDTLHYHVLVSQSIEQERLVNLRGDFVKLCLQHDIVFIK